MTVEDKQTLARIALKYKHTLKGKKIAILLSKESAIKGVKWVFPNKKQLEEEWKMENIDGWFFVGYVDEKETNRYKDIFIKNFKKFTTIKILKPKDIEKLSVGRLDYYDVNSIDDLKEFTSHMGKDVNYLVKQFDGGSLSMPILRMKDGKLTTVGGRTRISIARIANVPVKVVIVDHKKMIDFFSHERKKDFINVGYDIFAFMSDSLRTQIMKYFEGSMSLDDLKNILKNDKDFQEFPMSDRMLEKTLENARAHIFG